MLLHIFLRAVTDPEPANKFVDKCFVDKFIIYHHFPEVSGAKPKLEGRRLSGKWEKENQGNEKNLVEFQEINLKIENRIGEGKGRQLKLVERYKAVNLFLT